MPVEGCSSSKAKDDPVRKNDSLIHRANGLAITTIVARGRFDEDGRAIHQGQSVSRAGGHTVATAGASPGINFGKPNFFAHCHHS